MSKTIIFPLLPVLVAASLALSACGTAETQGTPSSVSQDASASHGASALVVGEPWVKASKDGMTGAFGILSNTTDHDITVVGATSPAAATVELHETVPGSDGTLQMRAKDGGFVIPAKGEFVLEPGASHIMLMGLKSPLAAGDDITFELHTSDGGRLSFTAPAKDFSGANENYEGSHGTDASQGAMDPSGEASHPASPTQSK